MLARFDLRRSVTGKVLFIGLLTLLLLIPMSMIEGLILERTGRYAEARADIANSWGDAQTIGAPILVVPFEYTRLSSGYEATVADELYLLPEDLEIDGDVQTEERRRGIYKVPVYTARLTVRGRFAPPRISGDLPNLVVRWEQAQLALPLRDARPIKEPVRIELGDGTAEFQPGGTRVVGFGPQLVAPYAELGLGALDAPQAFSLQLVLGGSSALEFLPLGGVTRVSMTSSWASPSFDGSFLPEQRTVTDAGFAATWRVLALGRGYPSTWRRSDPPPSGVEASAFGASLITPIGIHEASLRAAKYAVLIIGLTFAAYFLFELFSAVRLHTLQYLLIGAANCVFFLLLLALAEHVGFAPAYAVSAVASTALISTYSAAVLGALRRALPIALLLGSTYGYLYVTLQAEDYALLFGALGLFTALAAFMYLTRRIDWHAVSFAAVNEMDPGAQLRA